MPPWLEGEMAEDSNARYLFCAPSLLMEVLRELRYQLFYSALFLWQSLHHRRMQGEVSTRDVSVLGSFFVTATCPPLKFPFKLSSFGLFSGGTKTDIRIRGEGRVIRVEHPSGGRGENGRILV